MPVEESSLREIHWNRDREKRILYRYVTMCGIFKAAYSRHERNNLSYNSQDI